MQKFGGDWTDNKLERLKKYLAEYIKILKNKPFKFAYIDAFAGTGYRKLKTDNRHMIPSLFPELAQKNSQKLLDGSARIALRTEPVFHEVHFYRKR